MNQFKTMNLPAPLERALEAMSFSVPTPIQTQAIPPAMTGRDLIGCAQTGTGKTAAFGIPLIARLIENPKKTALILAPTRELVVQIMEVLRQLCMGSNDLHCAVLIGGANIRPQIRALQRNPRIVVATPGRLIDHLNHHTVSLADVGILVLDEADRMLDMGFAPQLREILRYVPRERQTLLFSATLPDDIQQLAARILQNPIRVSVEDATKPVYKIKQSVIETTAANKNDVLVDQLNARKGSVLIFTRTKHRTERLAKYLEEYGYAVARIHGGRSQNQRTLALEGFRTGEFRVLVATDIAARGLDVPHIAHVINYDLPQVPEDYVHRIGRTARAGAEGEALCLVSPEEKGQWLRISRATGAEYSTPEMKMGRSPGAKARSRQSEGSSERGKSFGRKSGSRSVGERSSDPRSNNGKSFGQKNRKPWGKQESAGSADRNPRGDGFRTANSSDRKPRGPREYHADGPRTEGYKAQAHSRGPGASKPQGSRPEGSRQQVLSKAPGNRTENSKSEFRRNDKYRNSDGTGRPHRGKFGASDEADGRLKAGGWRSRST